MILTEHGHSDGRRDYDRAVRGLELTAEYFQKCRLARAVCADYTVAVAGRKFEIDALEQGLGAEIEAEIGYCYHLVLPFFCNKYLRANAFARSII